jgi:hypothetical protein
MSGAKESNKDDTPKKRRLDGLRNAFHLRPNKSRNPGPKPSAAHIPPLQQAQNQPEASNKKVGTVESL